jgi:hypothetical protein
MRTLAFRLSPFVLILLFIACGPTYPPDSLTISEMSHRLAVASETAAAAATLAGTPTAQRIETLNAIQDQRVQADIHSTDTSNLLTRVRITEQGATATHAAKVEATQDARNEEEHQVSQAFSYRWSLALLAGLLALVLLSIVAIHYLYELGKVHLAQLERESRYKSDAYWDDENWIWRPHRLPESSAPAIPPPASADVQRTQQAAWDHACRQAVVYLVEWAHRHETFRSSRLCGELHLCSDQDWRTVTGWLVTAKVLIRTGGKRKNETDWAPGWDYDTFAKKLGALAVDYGAPALNKEPPTVISPYRGNALSRSAMKTDEKAASAVVVLEGN